MRTSTKSTILVVILIALLAPSILPAVTSLPVNANTNIWDGASLEYALSSPVTIYVPDDYPTIQAAVDAASDGDTIIVRDGTYTENVNVYGSLIIKSENGAGSTVVQAANSNDHVFEVIADDVSISGFTVRGATEGWGIFLSSSSSNIIENNICFNNGGGIALVYSNNNLITNNNCYNGNDGITLWNSNYNSIKNNNCSKNGDGIKFWNSSNNNLIYLNNLINNIRNGFSHDSTNTWNSPEKITYIYNSDAHTNYLGNYYNDYSGSDANGDGIGDTLYAIDGDNDNYPLMEPFENYIINQSVIEAQKPSLSIGNYWKYSIKYFDSGMTGTITREIIGESNVIIGTQSYECFKIKILQFVQLDTNEWSMIMNLYLLKSDLSVVKEDYQVSQNGEIYQISNVTYSPPLKELDFPIIVGKKWTAETTKTETTEIPPQPPVTHITQISQNFSVVRTEKVTVPAGTFDTLVIKHETSDNIYEEYYSSLVGGNVRESVYDKSWNEEIKIELLEYNYAPENQPPNPPTLLSQCKTDGTEIPVRGVIDVDENTVILKGMVNDPNGDLVKLQIELRRLDEYGGYFSESGGGFKESEWVGSGSEAVVYVYGLVEGDYHWRARVIDENGEYSDWVEFGSNDISETDFTVYAVSRLKDTISNIIQQQITYTYPPYYWWMPGEEYREFYWAGVDYDCLSFNALIKANDILKGDSLKKEDVARAEKYLQKFWAFGELSYLNFRAANLVADGNLAEAQEIALIVKESCQFIVKYGTLYLAGPSVARGIDCIYMVTDLVIDWYLVGEEQAAKDLMVKLIVNQIFNDVEFDSLGGFTLSEWFNYNVDKPLFSLLDSFAEDKFKHGLIEFIEYLPSELAEQGVTISTNWLTDEGGKRLAELIIIEMKSIVDFEQARLESPGELRVYDSQGRVTGLLNGEVKSEAARSAYYNGTIMIFYPMDSYSYEVAGTEEGTYGLTIISFKDGEATTFTATNIPISPDTTHRYTIDWDALSQGEEGVTLQIDSDGDGTFEQTVTADNDLTQDELVPPKAELPLWIWMAIGVAVALTMIIVIWRLKLHSKEKA